MQEPNAGMTEILGEHATNPPNDRTSGDQLYSLDKFWTVSTCEQRIKSQFEQWVRGNALKCIQGMPLSEEDKQAALAGYIADHSAGEYNWPATVGVVESGKFIRKALGSVPGALHFFYLLLLRCDKTMTEDVARKVFRGNSADASRMINWALGLGNAQAPATKEPGQTETETLDGP